MKRDLSYFWCIAYRRHYWIPTEGEAGVVGGAKCIRWIFSCEHCDSHANEWRDLFGVRIPGTQRQYELGKGYKRALVDIMPGEAFLMLAESQGKGVPFEPVYRKGNLA